MDDTDLKGYHILADLWGCPSEYLEEAGKLEVLLMATAQAAGFSVVGKSFYQFQPRGATGVLLLESSHISAHSWPEYDFMALDVYSCSGKEKAQKAIEYLFQTLKPKKVQMKEMERFR